MLEAETHSCAELWRGLKTPLGHAPLPQHHATYSNVCVSEVLDITSVSKRTAQGTALTTEHAPVHQWQCTERGTASML